MSLRIAHLGSLTFLWQQRWGEDAGSHGRCQMQYNFRRHLVHRSLLSRGVCAQPRVEDVTAQSPVCQLQEGGGRGPHARNGAPTFPARSPSQRRE